MPKRIAIMTGQRIILMVALLVMFTVSESNSYISKIVCFQQFQLYLLPGFKGSDTSGFPKFRNRLDSCSFDQKYHMFDSLKAVLVDSLARTWKMDYLMVGLIQPIFKKFWLPVYLHDDAFFKYALRQCENGAIAPDSSKWNAYYLTQYYTSQNIIEQWWALKEHPDSNICLRNNYGFVDSIATLILSDDGLPRYYRRHFFGMDRYSDPIDMIAGGFSLKIDSTFKGRQLYDMFAVDSSFIAVAGDTGLIAVSTDAGHQWRKTIPFTRSEINAIGFLTKAKGYCIESNMEIWSTTDSGATWQKTDVSPGMPEKMVVFDSTRLMIFDDFNGNVLSGDGGKTWTKTSVLFNNFTSVIKWNCAYGLGGAQLRKTIDGGVTWNDICLVSNQPRTMTFLDENIGLIGCAMGAMSITTDAGKNWRNFFLPTIEDIICIVRLTDRSIVALSEGFSVFSTRDTGVTWTTEKVYHPTGVETGVQLTNQRSVWAGGNGFLFFCEAPAVTKSAPGQQGTKPMTAFRPRFHAAASYTIDGRRRPARNGAPGVRLMHGFTGNLKTVIVR